MNEREKQREWIHFYKASPPGYRHNALIAVLENDGMKMLTSVLKELGLVSSADLIEELRKNQ